MAICPVCKKRKIAYNIRVRSENKVFEEISLCKKCYLTRDAHAKT